MPYRAMKLLSRRMGVELYDSSSLRKELRALTMLSTGKYKGVHYLYGDRDVFLGLNYPFRKSCQVGATFHKVPSVMRARFVGRAPLRGIDIAVAVGRNQLELLRELGVERAEFIPHGIDTATWKQLTIEWQPTRAVAVGTHLRDFDGAIAVAERLAREVPGFQLELVVSRAVAARLRSSPAIRVSSGLTDEALAHRYASAAFHLLVLEDTTANNALLEGMAVGVPTVITEVGAARDYADETHTFFCRPGVDQDYVDACLALIRDGDLNQRMRRAAREAALTFEWSRIATRIWDLYA